MSGALYPLEEVLHPRAVAILGASRAPHKWGHVAARQLIAGGFPGPVYLINPSIPEVLDRPTYPTLLDVPEQVDLAIIATAYQHVPQAIDDCIAHGVKGIVIITAGFSETGPDGRALEQELVTRCHQHGIRIIGSNCMGVYIKRAHLNALGMAFPLPAGPIGLVSQSGNLGMYFYAQAQLESCGFTTFLSVGNAVDVSFPECMQYLANDPETQVIAGYVEAIQEQTLREVTQDLYRRGRYKPTVILLSGATEVGVRASLAHTGTISTVRPDHDNSLFGSGVVRVVRSDELFPVARALATQPPTPDGGRRFAIIGDGGGSVVATGDAAIRAGLEVPTLSAETQQGLRALMPARATATNPVDVAGAADEDPLSFAWLSEVCLKDPLRGRHHHHRSFRRLSLSALRRLRPPRRSRRPRTRQAGEALQQTHFSAEHLRPPRYSRPAHPARRRRPVLRIYRDYMPSDGGIERDWVVFAGTGINACYTRS